jgi:hypothetical protein
MRAPPEAVNTTSGQSRLIASRAAAMKPWPAACPSEPPRKPKFCTRTMAARFLIRPWAIDMASISPVDARAEFSRST